MATQHNAATFCEEFYCLVSDIKEGYIICPNCGEPIYMRDWEDRNNWCYCRFCGEFLTPRFWRAKI